MPVVTFDEISHKSLPPTYSFCSLDDDNLAISSLKKSDLDPTILLRVYEIYGASAETSVKFLGQERRLREVNLLEEEIPKEEQLTQRVAPFEIRTIKLQMGHSNPAIRAPAIP